MKNAIIIGAGIGGLGLANLLAAGGYTVSVYEKNGQPGGRAGQLHIDGFTYDSGPSWYLMPEVFEHYFALLGYDIDQLLDLRRLDPAYKVFFEHRPEPITIHGDLSRDRKTFDWIEPGAGNALERYLHSSEKIYTAAMDNFLYTSFTKPSRLIRPGVLPLLPKLVRTAFQPIDHYVGGYFTDLRLRQILEYPMVFLGTSPYEAPALYSLMSHMDFTQGVFYPQGGIYKVIDALTAIGIKTGVTYHYGSEVRRIITANGAASGIELTDGTVMNADIVISNADLHFTETKLLKPDARTYDVSYWDRKQAGPSALLMYLGVKGKLPQLEHHTLLFTEDWKQNFDAIFKQRTWPDPASIYICKPSQTDPNVAPKGFENLFVLVPAPAGTDTATEDLQEMAEGYLDQIARMTGIADLRKRTDIKKLVGPKDFARDFNAWQGTALGLSHLLGQSALFRPSNRSKKVKNLYYVGGNTLPGIGLPMCLIGAELVYKHLAGDVSSRPVRRLRELPDA